MASIKKREGRPLPWCVIWREPENKKQCWKAFATKREALDFQEKVSQAIRGGTYVSPAPVPFNEYALDWLARKRVGVSINAHAIHRWAVEKHLVPTFGEIPLQNIRPDRIERYQADLLTGGGLKPKSVRIIRQVLRAILQDAMRKGYLMRNPVELTDTVDVPQRELQYLSLEQIRDLCLKAGAFYGTLFLMQALCGLRAGEVLGLRWGDVDLERGRLTVRRQVIWLRAKDVPEGEPSWHFAEPKSEAGKRVVEIPLPLVTILQEFKAKQNGEAIPDALVFATRDGTPLCQRNIRRRHFKPALKALGLSGIRPHDFRRSFVAMHVMAGTHPKLVQTRIGHSNISLTMDVYGRLAGDIALGAQETAKLNSLATTALSEFGSHLANMRPRKALESA